MVTAEGLRPLKEVGIYGRVTVMKMFRPPVRSCVFINKFAQYLQFFDISGCNQRSGVHFDIAVQRNDLRV